MANGKWRKAGKQVIASIGRDDCALCRREIVRGTDELLLGSTERAEKYSVHYFCMLFSSNLIQEGEDDQGIKGFLDRSIIKEIGRGSYWLCAFCRKPGATIGCVNAKCRKMLHFPCGLENDATFNFASPSFETFCPDHSPFPVDIVRCQESECSICLRGFKRHPDDASRPVTCPKCQNSFHTNCLRSTALKSGIHHFRCPFCRDDKTFVVHCQQRGIYVPDQDAAWELDDAFSDHYEVLHTCNASQCLCPDGRMSDDGDWDIVSCSTCGLNAAHAKCRNLGDDDTYICPDCTPMPPTQADRTPVCSLNEWFYAKSRFHFREPTEVVQRLEKADDVDDIEIDVDSDAEEAPRKAFFEHSPDSPQESTLDLVLEENDDKSSDDGAAKAPSFASWREFPLVFSPVDLNLVPNFISYLPSHRSTGKVNSKPSCSGRNRSPLSRLQDGCAGTLSNQPNISETEDTGHVPTSQQPEVFDCTTIMYTAD